jgi:hypothetical protein
VSTNGLIGLDWVRLNAPPSLTRDGDLQVLGRQLRRVLAALVQQSFHQAAFAVLQGQDFFLHRPDGDQLVNENRFRLADAVGAVGGLRFHGRVPPRIVMDDRVRRRQVQAGAAGFEADQEQRNLAA